MNFKKRLLLVKLFFTGSISLSLLSMALSYNIYPFYSYKLYTTPLGAKEYYTEYRIYSIEENGNEFKRNSIKETASYDYDNYYYLLNYLASKSIESGNDQEKYKEKLHLFAKHIIPNQKGYKVVSETYKVSDLMNKKGISYDTTTIMAF